MQASPFTKVLDRRFSLSFTVRTALLFAMVVVVVFYSLWEAYWYRQVGLACVKWHTHVMLYVFLFVLGYACFKIVGFRFKGLQRILSSLWLGLFFMEVLLLLWGGYRSPFEKGSGEYRSPYEPSSSYYNTGTNEIVIVRQEFTYRYPLNSLGFPDREWRSVKDSSEKRILALGDSFTHGDGDAYGGAYVFRLGKLLNKQDNIDTPYYMMNGGFCGSDPFFNYVNLRDRLLPYSPNVVIQTIASQDMLEDFPIRGGMERFLPDKTLKYKSAPWWEPLFAMSDIVRVVASMRGYDKWLMTNEDKRPSNAMPKLIQLFSEYVALCRQQGIILYVVFRPADNEVRENRYDFDFSALKNYLNKQQDVYVYDLLPFYKQYTAAAGKDIKEYRWKMDAHHNAAGYQMMAEGVYAGLKPLLDSIPLN